VAVIDPAASAAVTTAGNINFLNDMTTSPIFTLRTMPQGDSNAAAGISRQGRELL